MLHLLNSKACMGIHKQAFKYKEDEKNGKKRLDID